MSDTPKPAHLRLVGGEADPKNRDEKRDTLEMEILPDFEEGQRGGVLLALPTKIFARGEIIVDLEHLPCFYLIVRGMAEECAVSSHGDMDADPITLRHDDVIGIHRAVRVVAKSDLVVRVIDFEEIKKTGGRLLLERANEIVREAAIGAATRSRDRLVRTHEEHLDLQQAIEKFIGMERELERLRSRDADHVRHGQMLSHEVLRQREELKYLEQQLAHREKELENRLKELESAVSISRMFKDDYVELVKEFASYAEAFENLQAHSDRAVSNRGVQLLGLLHTLRLKAGDF